MKIAGTATGSKVAFFAAAIALAGCTPASEQADGESTGSDAPEDIVIAGEAIFPESITSDAAGNIYVGGNAGTIYRAEAGAREAVAWIEPDESNGIVSLFGVLADDAHDRFLACSLPNLFRGDDPGGGSQLKVFDLETGEFRASHAFPGDGPAACNDIAISDDGTIYVTDTTGGRILSLAPDSEELTLFARGEELVGIDGIAFADDGTMYINNVRQNLLQRVERSNSGAYEGLTDLQLDTELNGPDGLRPLGGNRFIQAEGPEGRIALITVDGDSATVTPLRTGLDSSPAVTVVGEFAYAPESKIGYLMDPALRGQDPGPFMIRAFSVEPDRTER